MVVVSSARSFAARSPTAPPEKKTKRRGFLSPLPRLYRKTRLAIRTSREKKKPPFLPRSLFLFSLNLSLSRFPKEKMPALWSPEKKNASVGRSVGRSRKEGRALL